jgi:hypothetical protein
VDLRTSWENREHAAQEAAKAKEKKVYRSRDESGVIGVHGATPSLRAIQSANVYRQEHPEEFQVRSQDSQPQVTAETFKAQIEESARAEAEAARLKREHDALVAKVVPPGTKFFRGTVDVTLQETERRVIAEKARIAQEKQRAEELAARQAEKERLAKQGEVQLRNLHIADVRELLRSHDLLGRADEVAARMRSYNLGDSLICWETAITETLREDKQRAEAQRLDQFKQM